MIDVIRFRTAQAHDWFDHTTLRPLIVREQWHASRLPSSVGAFAALTRAMRSRKSGHLSERRQTLTSGDFVYTTALR